MNMATQSGHWTSQGALLVEARVTNEGKKVGVAYLLWFFLRIISAHRFYLGRPASALLQIAIYFCPGLGFLWLLADMLLIPPGMVRKSTSSFGAARRAS